MHQREVLGYSIYFKKDDDAKKFYKQVPKIFEPQFNKEEKEVMLLGCEQVKKEDFQYVFEREGKKVEVEPMKVMCLETLFARY